MVRVPRRPAHERQGSGRRGRRRGRRAVRPDAVPGLPGATPGRRRTAGAAARPDCSRWYVEEVTEAPTCPALVDARPRRTCSIGSSPSTPSRRRRPPPPGTGSRSATPSFRGDHRLTGGVPQPGGRRGRGLWSEAGPEAGLTLLDGSGPARPPAARRPRRAARPARSCRGGPDGVRRGDRPLSTWPSGARSSAAQGCNAAQRLFPRCSSRVGKGCNTAKLAGGGAGRRRTAQQSPATAGITEIRVPSGVVVARLSRNRTSSLST